MIQLMNSHERSTSSMLHASCYMYPVWTGLNVLVYILRANCNLIAIGHNLFIWCASAVDSIGYNTANMHVMFRPTRHAYYRQRRSWPGGVQGSGPPPPAPALTTRGIFANPMSFLGVGTPPPHQHQSRLSGYAYPAGCVGAIDFIPTQQTLIVSVCLQWYPGLTRQMRANVGIRPILMYSVYRPDQHHQQPQTVPALLIKMASCSSADLCVELP